MYFALYESGGRWYPVMLHHKMRFWETLADLYHEYPNLENGDPKFKVFCLDHTIDQQIKVANRLAELTNMVDEAIDKAQNLNVL